VFFSCNINHIFWIKQDKNGTCGKDDAHNHVAYFLCVFSPELSFYNYWKHIIQFFYFKAFVMGKMQEILQNNSWFRYNSRFGCDFLLQIF
jgi:hypothetical protein